jgi:FAD/FMN-containing dehydrogenase
MEVVMDGTTLDAMRTGLRGPLTGPEDPDYARERAVYNAMIDRRPSAILRCSDAGDVMEAVDFVREHGLRSTVRGGGHSGAGLSVADDAVVMDLSPMRWAHVDPESRTAMVGGGCLLGDLDHAAHAFGLATPAGIQSTTGVGGLALGGGHGHLTRKYGLTSDNLLASDVVLADGRSVTADERENPDLFWALRGGGGNFGVVTSFQYRAHRVTTVLGGLLVHPLSAAPAVLDCFRQFTAAAPDELGVGCGLVHAPDGSGAKIVALPVCHAAEDLQQAEADLKALREFGPPAMDTIQPMPYPAVNTMLDDAFPRGALNYWKSAFLTELSDAAVRIMVDAFDQAPSTMTCIILDHLHGEATRVDPAATAFPHRQPGYSLLLLTQWADPADTRSNIAWTRETFEALGPHMTDRRYMNYMSADDGGFVRQAYGPNYDRLVEVKRRYDPGNLFRLNQNIDPGT